MAVEPRWGSEDFVRFFLGCAVVTATPGFVVKPRWGWVRMEKMWVMTRAMPQAFTLCRVAARHFRHAIRGDGTKAGSTNYANQLLRSPWRGSRRTAAPTHGHRLRQHIMHDISEDICQAKIAARMTVCQTLMIQSQSVQNSGVKVVHMDRILCRSITEVVG